MQLEAPEINEVQNAFETMQRSWRKVADDLEKTDPMAAADYRTSINAVSQWHRTILTKLRTP